MTGPYSIRRYRPCGDDTPIMDSRHPHFAADYDGARRLFLAACAAKGLAVDSFRHPLRGPGGGTVALDTLRLGPADAPRRLCLLAGTHGVEGYFGSGVLTGLVADGHLDRLPAEMSVLILHGLNPWGFAWTRRVNEDNVDLNRNWIDFTRGRPRDGAYDQVADALLPDDLAPATLAVADARLRAYAAEHGAMALQTAVSHGQYHHEDGLYFGGFGPTWSRRRIAQAVQRHLAGADHVVVLDFHTGLGAYGSGELITIAPAGSDDYRRARDLFGDGVKSTASGDSLSAHLSGTLDEGFAALLAPSLLTFLALEVGARDTQTVVRALRDDNWLHRRGSLDTPLAADIKARLKDAFAPDERDWQDAVYALGIRTVEQALAGLKG